MLPPDLLLIAPHASYRTVAFMRAAERLGARVTIASAGRYSASSIYSSGIHIDFSDPQGALETLLTAAGKTPFDAVIGTDDGSTELAAALCQDLGLPHNPPSAVRTARRKDLARRCLAQAGVRVPEFRHLDLRQSLAAQMTGIGYPCVLKPIALSASKGVIRADTPDAFRQACGRITRILTNAQNPEERQSLLVEEFIPGMEVAVEGMLTAGKLEILAIFDKPEALDGPFFEESYYITPSRLPPAVQDSIGHEIQRACVAYGLCDGPVHGECRINDQGVWILEVAARTIGGLCGRLLRFGTGYGLEELVIAHALGRRPAYQASDEAAGVLMIPTPKAGILRHVEGVMAARKTPLIEALHIDVREGNELVPLPEGSSYLGFIFARGPTPAQVENALRSAHAHLHFVVAPLWKGIAI